MRWEVLPMRTLWKHEVAIHCGESLTVSPAGKFGGLNPCWHGCESGGWQGARACRRGFV